MEKETIIDNRYNVKFDKKLDIISYQIGDIEKRIEKIEKRLLGNGTESLCNIHTKKIESLATTFNNFKTFIYVLFSIITIFLVIIGWLIK